MDTIDTKIGLTLYNLRDYCRTEKDLDETLGRVKEIGYRAVQVSGVGDIEPGKIRNLLDKHELYCCATHEGLQAYEDDFERIVEKMKTLDCRFTALGSPGGAFWSAEGVLDLARRLENIGKKFRDQDIIFGFHNHHREFACFTGRTFLEELYANTTVNLFAELDTHWIQRGGGDPAGWIRKMEGRTSVIHFKDFAMSLDSNGEPVPEFAEIGEGNLNWPTILSACEETGVRWYVVEQDQPRGDRDIFESMRISFDNMKKMGIR